MPTPTRQPPRLHTLSSYRTDRRNCELLATDNIAEFRIGPEMPPGASVLLGAVLLAIEVATSPEELTTWCDRHHHLQSLLTPEEQAIAASRAMRRWALWELDRQASVESLAAWWAAEQPLLRQLGAEDLAQVLAAKEARKARLAPIPAGRPPPSVVRPHNARESVRAEGRLL